MTKKLILLAFISFVLLGTILFLLTLISSNKSNVSNNLPDSYPLSYSQNNSNNLITIQPNPYKKFKYATINSDDTVALLNSINEKTIIGLDHKQWKNVQWSQDGNLVSVLGKNVNNYDLFIYNLADKTWFQATNFQNTNNGVDSYVWKDSKIIFFTQGNAPDRWFHRFNFDSKTEILKLSRVEGLIYNISNDRNYIIIKNNNIFSILNSSGDLISTLKDLLDQENNNVNVVNILLNKSSQKLIIQSDKNAIYKSELGSLELFPMDLKQSFQPLCNIDDNVFNGFKIIDNKINILTFNIKESLENTIASSVHSNIINVNQNNTKCLSDGSFIINVITSSSSQPKWFEIKSTGLEEQFALEGDKEVDITKTNI